MATERINSIPSNKFQVVEQIDTDKQFTPADSGKFFVFDQKGTAYTMTLPKLSTNLAGWSTILTRRTNSGGEDLHILPNSGDEDTVFIIETREGTAETTNDPVDGIVINDYTAVSTFTIWLKISTNGTRWFVETYHTNSGSITKYGS